jgi:type I restriction enzyme, S subunit
MKLETFFEKFELFADAPNAVAKMRELVLHLAITGKLVPQDSNDESATTLCDPDVELVAQSSFEIPHGWAWTRLNNLADINGGFAFKSNAYTEEGTRVVRISDFDEFGFKDHKVVRHPFIPDLEKFSLAQNNILMAMTGGTVGKSYLIKSLSEQMVVNQRVATIKVSECANPSYIDIAVRSEMTQAVIRKAKNSTNDNISMGDIKGFAIPLPPLAEQKRIVAKVDELMALCDRLESQQQEREEKHKALSRASLARFADAPTPANLQFIFHPSYTISPADLRKSILALAVQGKLVHRIESEGIGSDILEKADVSLVQPDDVPDLPDHWVWARLGIIATRMDSGWSPACIPEPAAKGEWGVLKTTAVQTLQYQEVQNKALPPNLEPRPEHEVMDGDILFTRAGPMNRVGILCVARPTRKKLMISDKIIRFHLVTGIDPDFAALSMNAGFSSTVVEGLKSGMAASQVNISQPKLRSVPIPIPPIAEQRRIVAKVDELMKLVDALETQLATSRATAANLLAAIIAELTGTPNTAKVSVPASTSTGTGRRGRPPKS